MLGVGGGEVIIDIQGGDAKERVSRYFRFPEVGISRLCTTTTVQTLIDLVHLTINIFRQLPVNCYFHCTTNDPLHK